MRVLILLLSITFWMYAGINVIGPKSLPFDKMSEIEIQHLFLGKTEIVQGVQARPKDSTDIALYAKFCEKILGKSTHQIRSYWARMVFTGQQKPPVQISIEELKKSKIEEPPTITYVPSGEIISGWKVLYELKED